jgi:hypothetical protein
MATATRRERRAAQVAARANGRSGSAATKSPIFEDNEDDDRRYRWSILDARGRTRTRSESSADDDAVRQVAYDAARKAARRLGNGAGTVTLAGLGKSTLGTIPLATSPLAK